MKIAHSVRTQITSDTFVSSDRNGDSQSCTFIESGESVSICFDYSSIQKLLETIGKLQEIHQALVQERQRQIAREFDSLSLISSSLPVYIDDGKKCQEVEISF